jgi:nucleoid-associated protein YgaU
MRRPKAVAALLAGGTIALGGGSAVAASLPRPSHPAATAGASGARPAVTAPSSAPPPAARVARGARAGGVVAPALARTAGSASPAAWPGAHSTVTYTVKPGDTLSGIAEWFRLHGYGNLYAANVAVIGSDPNLINPGERITITDGVMRLSHPR